MRFYGIDFVAHELGVHASSLRRWEENGLIWPDRATMGKTTLRIYDEKTMRVLRRAKGFMDDGINVKAAFDQANQEEQHNDRYGNCFAA